MVKNLLANAQDVREAGSIPGLGRSPGEGHGNPLQYSCLENPMDRGAWRATVHRVTKSWTRLKRLSTHTRPFCLCEMNRRVNTRHSGLTRISTQGPLYSFLPLPSINFAHFFCTDGGGTFAYIEMCKSELLHLDRWKLLCYHILTDGNICATHAPVPCRTFYLPRSWVPLPGQFLAILTP